ncbi:hypothetical protein A0257_03550 [Hymenobacter psoromatis]|nr:hypothetical protein A0257_03550 [Hymenobacter psoromatis]
MELLFFLFLLLVPGLWLVRLALDIRFAANLWQHGVSGRGIVISQRTIATGQPLTAIYQRRTVVELLFTTATGTPVKVEKELSGNRLEFFDGDEVYLYYDANEPTSFLLIQELNQARNCNIFWAGLAGYLFILVVVVAQLF